MTKDDIIRMAGEAGFYIDQDWIDYGFPGFERFAALVAAAEREACAQLVERYTGAWSDEGYALTQAIRARGEK
jgi:hypothetical protein